jgi:hypothetical protein
MRTLTLRVLAVVFASSVWGCARHEAGRGLWSVEPNPSSGLRSILAGETIDLGSGVDATIPVEGWVDRAFRFVLLASEAEANPLNRVGLDWVELSWLDERMEPIVTTSATRTCGVSPFRHEGWAVVDVPCRVQQPDARRLGVLRVRFVTGPRVSVRVRPAAVTMNRLFAP